jgi:hypothetical protein
VAVVVVVMVEPRLDLVEMVVVAMEKLAVEPHLLDLLILAAAGVELSILQARLERVVQE